MLLGVETIQRLTLLTRISTMSVDHFQTWFQVAILVLVLLQKFTISGFELGSHTLYWCPSIPFEEQIHRKRTDAEENRCRREPMPLWLAAEEGRKAVVKKLLK